MTPPRPLPPHRESLKRRLRDATRVAFLAAGSLQRADDAAGMLAGQSLDEILKSRPPRVEARVFFGETMPENFTGDVKRFAPSHVVILDAADFGGAPGDIRIVEPGELTHNPSAFTHNMPYSLLASYLQSFIRCDVFILGIQPASRRFGEPVSDAVRTATREAAEALQEALA